MFDNIVHINAGLGIPGDLVQLKVRNEWDSGHEFQSFLVTQPGVICIPSRTFWCTVNGQLRVNL